MIWTELTKKAYIIALCAHQGQVDKAGNPYFEHPKHVAEQMDDEISCAVALLHDVLEDTALTAEQLAEFPVSLPPEVIESVVHLTHTPDSGLSYLDYVRSVREDPVATKVKIADLRHNSDISRLGHEPTEKDLSRLKRYQKALAILTGTE